MKIAVIGIGRVGSVLGRRWVEVGHQVTFGVRDKDDAKSQATVRSLGGSIANVAEAAASSDVVVLCTPWSATLSVVTALGSLGGKVVLDCTNPLTADMSGLEVAHNTSGGEEIARAAPGAKVVKIFNTTGSPNMANPRYENCGATMFYAGDDADAKKIAAQLASDLGFDPLDVGPLAMARQLEHLAVLWIRLCHHQGFGPDVAIKLLRRPV